MAKHKPPRQTPTGGLFTMSRQQKGILTSGILTLFTLFLVSLFLMPLGYGAATSLKNKAQIADPNAPLLPSEAATYVYEGQEYAIYSVPTEHGFQEWALVQRGREDSYFIDPEDPAAGLIHWDGRWRSLDAVYSFAPKWENYTDAWQKSRFLGLLTNTLLYAVLSTFGAVSSAALVAYGFARFRIPYKNVLFMIVIATIILPPQVTLVPTYAFFTKIGWTGTWLPLIVPAYFANGYNIFLLRQYFLTIPREMDEAAMIDGAGPLRIFLSVIVPQAVPALTAVSLFHFFFAWNDFFGPLIYLAGKPHLFPIQVGLNAFNGLFNTEANLIQAASVMALIPPVIIFFLAQRVFMQGIVITGVDK
jgi:multiple sugar transport system permease protein